MYKVIIFSYLFWFVLTIIFITGTTRISIFCMGYLVACFYFLLFGGDLLLKPIRSILRYWDWLIAYNVFVITMKNILSVGICCLSSALITSVSLEVCAVHWVAIKNPFLGPQPPASTKQSPFQFSTAREWQCISITGKCLQENCCTQVHSQALWKLTSYFEGARFWFLCLVNSLLRSLMTISVEWKMSKKCKISHTVDK